MNNKNKKRGLFVVLMLVCLVVIPGTQAQQYDIKNHQNAEQREKQTIFNTSYVYYGIGLIKNITRQKDSVTFTTVFVLEYHTEWQFATVHVSTNEKHILKRPFIGIVTRFLVIAVEIEPDNK